MVANFVTTRVRKFIHPLPPAGFSRLSQGEKVGDSICNYSLPSGASEVFRRSTACASVPREGRTFQFAARPGWGGVHTLQKPLHPSLHGAGRRILVSPRLGPRMESSVNMNEQAHDNMSAPPRQNDGDDGCSKCTATTSGFYSITN